LRHRTVPESRGGSRLQVIHRFFQGSVTSLGCEPFRELWKNSLAAAEVDGYAIAGITRKAQNVTTAMTFDPATVPALGSIGAARFRRRRLCHAFAFRFRDSMGRGWSLKLNGAKRWGIFVGRE
jgi:hypothetical protein